MREHDFLFRTLGSEMSLVWCELLRRDLPEALEHPARRERVQKRLAKNFKQGRVLRLWPLHSERELVLGFDCALMRHTGADFWLRLDWLFRFSGNSNEFFFRADLSGVEAALEPSEAAWNFVDRLMKEEENGWQWFDCARGDKDELKRALRAYMTISGHYLNSFEKGDLRLSSLLQVPHDAPSSEWSQLRRVAWLFDQHFVLRFNSVARRVHTREGKPRKRPEIYIRLPTPTSQHERLEALLVWREFLQNKLPPAAIEAWLKPFST